MRKIIFFIGIIIISLQISYSYYDWENKRDFEYINGKKNLEEDMSIERCLDFGKEFFGEEKKLDGCLVQFFYKNTKTEDFFYKKFRKKILELQFGGDIMLSRGVGARNKKYGYDRIFKKFHPNKGIPKNTILFYNLESLFSETDNDFDRPGFMFKANKKNIEVLNELKGNNKMIISLANNHTTNVGGKGIDTTLELLKENNIYGVGVGRKEPEIKEIYQNGIKVCFGAYTYDGDIFYSRDKDNVVQKYFINKVSKDKIFKDLEQMKEKNCNFNVISLHWGTEYKFEASENQKKLAHEIIDNGADLILGGHTHILGEIEEYKGKMIYYSLGNFIFDQNWGKNAKGSGYSYTYDEKLGKNTVPTYIGNTFYNKYEIVGDKIKILDTKNIKHRIDYGELDEF